jgi:regulator of protease activity HflC (stomatin/prohibitin superfamily)
MYPKLVTSIIDNMNLSNREELIATLEQANQPNPEAEQQAMQAQQAAQQAQLAFQAAQAAALNGQAQESAARSQKLAMEAQAIPQELEIDRIKAVTTNLKAGDADDKEFQKRLDISKQLLKEREVAVKEGNVATSAAPQQPQGMMPNGQQ